MDKLSDIMKNAPQVLLMDFEFLDLLGEGANGKTYLARQRATGNSVAIKALKLADDFKALELFKREAEILESIQVEGVPKFYLSIIPENPMVEPCYIIQEYVEYPSLQAIMDSGYIFTEKETLEIMRKIAEILVSLQTLYTPPIIHRDIKPSNILCCKKESGDICLYLIDFGAVANPQKKSGGSTIAGTFGYMAPEQMQGEVCVQTDFYSLGATAVHLLTGQSPVKMSSEMFRLDFEPAIASYAPATSKRTIELLSRLLNPVVNKRPESAVRLLDFITTIQAGKRPNYDGNAKRESVDFLSTDRISFLDRIIFKLVGMGRKKADNFFSAVENWRETKGVIQRMCMVKEFVCYEYTYEVDGRAYCGISETRRSKAQYQPEQLPVEADILYNPGDPRMSMVK